MATLGSIVVDELMVAMTPRVLGKEEKCTPALAHATKQEITTIHQSTNPNGDPISAKQRYWRGGEAMKGVIPKSPNEILVH
jgi:hypothetical protein